MTSEMAGRVQKFATTLGRNMDIGSCEVFYRTCRSQGLDDHTIRRGMAAFAVREGARMPDPGTFIASCRKLPREREEHTPGERRAIAPGVLVALPLKGWVPEVKDRIRYVDECAYPRGQHVLTGWVRMGDEGGWFDGRELRERVFSHDAGEVIWRSEAAGSEIDDQN